MSEDGPTESFRSDEEDSGALAGRTLGGRYRLLEVLGTGGMGTVYRAQHVIIERPAAVKVLARQFCTVRELRERFYREARIATRIRHPNVLDVIDLGQTDSLLLYLVMELLNGRTLAKRLAGGPVPAEQLVDIFLEVCDGLGAAHEVGIIHRDVSPSNVFLVDPEHQEGGPPVLVKLLDFGIAFMKSEVRLTRPGEVLGTPYYIAPETLRGEGAAPTVDVYSLGATMYEAFGGRPPFEAARYTDILNMHLTDAPLPLRQHRSDLPDPLDKLVLACLEKDPRRRPSSMREVAAELQRVRREVAGRSRKSAPVDATAVGDGGESPTIGSGLAAWKQYLRSIIGRSSVLPPERRRQIHELEAAIDELEALDDDLKLRRDTLAEAEARAQSAEQRFARALEAMRAEEARLLVSGDTLCKALDAASGNRREAEAALADARSRVLLLEGAAAAEATAEGTPAAPGPRSGAAAHPDDQLVAAYETVGLAAARVGEARTAERAAQRDFETWDAELADVRFQINRLVAAAESAHPAAESERDRAGIRRQEEKRAVLWARLIDLASAISRG